MFPDLAYTCRFYGPVVVGACSVFCSVWRTDFCHNKLASGEEALPHRCSIFWIGPRDVYPARFYRNVFRCVVSEENWTGCKVRIWSLNIIQSSKVTAQPPQEPRRQHLRSEQCQFWGTGLDVPSSWNRALGVLLLVQHDLL